MANGTARLHGHGGQSSFSLEASLRKVFFFTGLTGAQLRGITAVGAVTACPEDTIVFREGDSADALYVILCGKVRVYKEDDGGREVTLAWPEEGDFFGEMALLDGDRRSASVATVTRCRFFTLDRTAFLRTITGSTELLGRLMTELTTRIRSSSERVLREEMAAQRLRVEAELQRHRALSQMVAGVAHELNTPLGIARTAASVLRQLLSPDALASAGPAQGPPLPVDDVLEAVDLMDRNILRAHELVQEFKAVSVGQMTDSKERLNLSEVIREIVHLYTIEARRAKLDIHLEDALTDESRFWTGYRGYLTQVLMNLLTNVERYAYPDGEGGRVEITVSSSDDGRDPCFTISVRDFGAGIPAEQVPKIFEPFFTTGRSKGGTGLGMAIVHNIVTSVLKGTIRVDSAPGEGTTFEVSFPETIPD